MSGLYDHLKTGNDIDKAIQKVDQRISRSTDSHEIKKLMGLMYELEIKKRKQSRHLRLVK